MTDWYEMSFGEDYLLVYKHRDFAGAYREVEAMARWLQLPVGAEVFDLCCGMGRHSLALTNLGYKVTGMDLSEVLLHEARNTDVNKAVRWVHGDMRAVPLDETFDAVVNLFTSFGYFGDMAENTQVLHEIQRLVKPEGRFLIDFLNPESVRRKLVPYSERLEGDITIKEYRRIEDGSVKKDIVMTEASKPERRYSEQVKLYELSDFVHMLASTSLEISEVYGDYEGSVYEHATSARLIMVGSRKV
ncbi:MAG: class I SAM-dependent methyltransferase [Paenibacillaceae bacterium]